MLAIASHCRRRTRVCPACGLVRASRAEQSPCSSWVRSRRRNETCGSGSERAHGHWLRFSAAMAMAHRHAGRRSAKQGHFATAPSGAPFDHRRSSCGSHAFSEPVTAETPTAVRVRVNEREGGGHGRRQPRRQLTTPPHHHHHLRYAYTKTQRPAQASTPHPVLWTTVCQITQCLLPPSANGTHKRHPRRITGHRHETQHQGQTLCRIATLHHHLTSPAGSRDIGRPVWRFVRFES